MKNQFGTAFGPEPLDSSLEGYKGYNQNNIAQLEALGGKNTPSPDQGPPPEGALGAPEKSGESSFLGKPEEGAIDAEPAKDMLSIMDEADPDDFEEIRKKSEEAYAPFGKSVEGATADYLQKGGPEAWARAAKFGIDLTPFASAGQSAIRPDQPGQDPMQKTDKAVGQAFGNVPTDEQSASGMPYADQDVATDKMQQGRKGLRQDAEKKRLEQRARMGYFLLEAGLRTIASERDAGAAVAEGALGAMGSAQDRKREEAAMKLDAEERERQRKRQDESDTIMRQREAREQSRFEKEAKREGLEKIVTRDGNVEFIEIKKGRALDQDGNPIEVPDPSALSATAWRGAVDAAAQARSREETAVLKALENMNEDYPGIKPIMDATDPEEKQRLIRELVEQKVRAQGYFAAQPNAAFSNEDAEEVTNFVDW